MMTKAGICSMETPPKLPSPHTIYDCTPSSVAKKLSSEMADVAIYPIMIPMMSSITLLRTMVANTSIRAITNMAPTKAAANVARKPVNEKAPAVILPPRSSITNATPSEAPLLIPKIPGSANGFRKAVCSIRPLTANEAPQSMAVIPCGNLLCNTIYSHEGRSLLPPIRMFTTSFTGMSTAPTTRLIAKSITISSVIKIVKRRMVIVNVIVIVSF